MSIYQHFRPEEKEFIDQVFTWKQYVEDTYAPKVTDFLDPREQFIVQSIIGSENICQVGFFGGHEQAERKRALIYPEYLTPSEEDYQIKLFEVQYPEKFFELKHPQILGSLMGLGLRRGKFGDILLKDKQVQFLVAEEVAEYIRLHFHAVGKTTVHLLEKKLSDVIQIDEVMIESQETVSSMRLDTILSTVCRIPRQKAQVLIQQELVKVNWNIVVQSSFLIEEGDMISARGYGRFKMIHIGDKTKKDKWRITVGKIK